MNIFKRIWRRLQPPIKYEVSIESIPVYTEEEARRRATTDYEFVLGRRLIVNVVDGYKGYDNAVVAGRSVVLVQPTDVSDYAERFLDEYLDPVWDVKVLEGAALGLRSTWVYGPGYLVESNR